MSACSIGMLFCFSSLTALGCASEPGSQSPAVAAQRVATATDTFAAEREAMVDQQIRARGIKAPAVLKAMREVPRHRFVPPPVRHMAYHDQPLPIGSEQTISQPYIVAYMTEAADISPDESVLEIGTGSGYQAAVLGEIAREVYTIEIIPELAERAHNTLAELGYTNVHTKTGNGYLGWPEHAPFDAILVTAAPEQVPQALVDQLALGGRIVVPVGSIIQDMMIIEKTRKGVVERRTIPVRFVPMTGKPRHGDQSDHLLLPVRTAPPNASTSANERWLRANDYACRHFDIDNDRWHPYNASNRWHEDAMRIRTPREIGLLTRGRRKAVGLTQAQLAEHVGASREWVRQLESGKPGLELGLTLRALGALGIVLDVEAGGLPRPPQRRQRK